MGYFKYIVKGEEIRHKNEYLNNELKRVRARARFRIKARSEQVWVGCVMTRVS